MRAGPIGNGAAEGAALDGFDRGACFQNCRGSESRGDDADRGEAAADAHDLGERSEHRPEDRPEDSDPEHGSGRRLR